MLGCEACVATLALAMASSTPARGAVGDAVLEAALGPRSHNATRIRGLAPTIDGRLDDSVWAEAHPATDLVQRRPQPGALATVRTEARFLYDDDALYVGVRLLDSTPETIVAPYPRRDDETTSDWVFLELDTRHDRRNAFSLGLNPRGVQVDGVFQNDVDWDFAWDAVWEGAARIDALGWTAEYRIPFSQLVYAIEGDASDDGSAPAVFGLNVYRYNPSRGETSNWSPRLPSLAGIVSNFNELHLRVPSSRSRLELVPFVSARKAPPERFASGTSASGGLDARAGLASSFTLRGAVRPDFGQVESDPSEVNLTTFETLFTERRPLFVEHASLFAFDLGLPLETRGNSFAAERPFYSRRVGRPPRLAAPETARQWETSQAATLLGALKLTGRTAGGWSLGTFAAATGSEEARFLDASGAPRTIKVEPTSKSGVVRIAKDFRQGRTAVGVIATLLDRSGMTPALSSLLPRRSFVGGLDARHRFAADAYEATGSLLASEVRGRAEAISGVLHGPGHYTQRSDATHLNDDMTRTSASGFTGQARLARIGGEHWRWALAGRVVSPRLELNDLGFQHNADWIVAFGSLGYQHERPGRRLRRWSLGSNQVGWGWSFGGERRAAVVNVRANADLNNYWGGLVSLDHEFPALQTEALRGGPALLMPSRDAATLSLYSDTRKVSQVTLEARTLREPATASRQIRLTPGLSLRPNDRLALSMGPSIEWNENAWQYVGAADDGERTRYVLGRLDQTTVSLTLRADLAFSPRLTLQLYAQPFASRGGFADYKEVVAPRASRPADRVGVFRPEQLFRDPAGSLRIDLGSGAPLVLADPTYRVHSLRANVVLRWEYRPGSALYVVWSQNRDDSIDDSRFDAGRDLVDVFGVRPRNTFLVKLSYWFMPSR